MGNSRENDRFGNAVGRKRHPDLKQFVEAREGMAHPGQELMKATGTNRLEDRQNQFIDNRNLRK